MSDYNAEELYRYNIGGSRLIEEDEDKSAVGIKFSFYAGA